MLFNNFETAKRDFAIFSKKVSTKQNVLSKRHAIMKKNHAEFRSKVNKRFNTYSKQMAIGLINRSSFFIRPNTCKIEKLNLGINDIRRVGFSSTFLVN